MYSGNARVVFIAALQGFGELGGDCGQLLVALIPAFGLELAIQAEQNWIY